MLSATFVQSSKVESVIAMAKQYGCRPSTVLGLDDDYTAFCFDEACAYITGQLEKGEQPQFKRKYKSFKDIYAQYK